MQPDPLRVEDIFSEALNQPAGQQRAAFLQGACRADAALRARVEELLQAHERAGSFMDTAARPELAGPEQTTTASARERPGTVIGRYKLLQEIGEGGFGRVFMAEQTEPVVRRVALKIIKLGMDTRQVIARFEAERQALAMMDHPNIAKVLDAGATPEGRPFFVMELVRGEPITEYCDKNNLGIDVRLSLFQQTCNAVQHAHQKGIIHRDIKPTNVLVTLADGKPMPKVIDFGIAKATSARLTEKTLFTEFRHLIGTPAYMSPEQAESSGVDIDTRSDIYSLGVLLYELLTGTTPFDPKRLRSAAYGEIQRIIREEEPPKPSTRLSTLETLPAIAAHRHTEPAKLSRTLRGDLDWIVMKCLEKDRTRRYETANGLALDIQRHLENEPVLAGPPGTGYRVRKFMRRHRGGVLAACGIVAFLILGVIGTGTGLVVASHQKDRAEDEATRAKRAEEEAKRRATELEQVARFQAALFEQLDPQSMGLHLRKQIISEAASGLEASGASRDEVAAARKELGMLLANGNTTNVALRALYENVFAPALEAVSGQFKDQPLVRARLLQTLADTLRKLGLLNEAAQPQAEALEIRRKHLGNENRETLDSVSSAAVLLSDQSRLSEAQTYAEEALEGRQRVFGHDDPDTLASLRQLGSLMLKLDRLDEAERFYIQALEGYRRVLGDDDPATIASVDSMGWLALRQGNYDAAENHLRRASEAFGRSVGPTHTNTLTSMSHLARLLRDRGRSDEAEVYLRKILEIRRATQGDEHPATLSSISDLGLVLRAQRNYAEAEPLLRESLVGRRSVLGANHPTTLGSLSNLATLYMDMARLGEAEELYREALQGFRRAFGERHSDTLLALNNLAVVLIQQGRGPEAEPYLRQAVDGYGIARGPDHPDTVRAIGNLGALLRDQGKLVEAEPYLRAALESHTRRLGSGHRLTSQARNNLAKVLEKQERYEEVEPMLRQILAHLEASGSGDTWAVGDTHRRIAVALMAMGRYRDAEDQLLISEPLLSAARDSRPGPYTDFLRAMVALFESWNAADPDADHAAKISEWRGKLSAWEVTSGPEGRS